MPDMLARLYDLPDPAPYDGRTAAAGVVVRRIDAWDRDAVRAFVLEQFSREWAAETDFAMSQGHPVPGFVAVKDGAIVGFAVYESSRRGFFGPTGVREDLRGNAIGASLLLRCLEGMRDLGYAYAIIGGVGPAKFYTKVCGATIIEGSDASVYRALYEEMAARRRASPGPA